MRTLIVSDIFGRTEALESLASKVADSAGIIDPYGAMKMGFISETEAYQYFVNNVGLDTYRQILQEHISANSSPMRLIGFSVGASAIWNASDSASVSNIIEATCFYGSQIRFNLEIKPKFPVKLIFPAFEQHFSVLELIDALSEMKNVTIEQTSFLHGFMNKHSNNYDPHGYSYGLKELCGSAC